MAPPNFTAADYYQLEVLLRKAPQDQLYTIAVRSGIKSERASREDLSDSKEDGLSPDEEVELIELIQNAPTWQLKVALAQIEHVSVSSSFDQEKGNAGEEKLM